MPSFDSEQQQRQQQQQPQQQQQHQQNQQNQQNEAPNILPRDASQIPLYYHQPNVVPTYVLDRLAQAHYKEQLLNSNVNNEQTDTSALVKSSLTKSEDEDQYLLFSNDPFVLAISGGWHQLMSAVQMPNQHIPMTTGRTSLHLEAGFKEPWGGDKRLMAALVGGTLGADLTLDYSDVTGFWTRLFSRKTARDDDSPRHRSQAGYWMLVEKRRDMLSLMLRMLVHNPLVPLFLRVLILMMSAAALALAVLIYIYLRRKYQDVYVTQQPSTIFAIVVQCFAVVYVVYIAYDEYLGKPLGLRNPLGKLKLLMLDLLFIICLLANMSLAFYLLYDDQWVCQDDNTQALRAMGIYYPTVSFLCRRQKALASFLLMVLCLWVIAFAISIIRVVDRVVVGPRDD